ncbi:hypothetical protein [[Mycoplasma] testudinis]|uniref:hypothetical protein n=1 Tax=[Mycoplasma] testudinis TaxID=33924 RepID=UPI00069895C1|nr:hypothetical protein [[Mycoplasma] testudinis]
MSSTSSKKRKTFIDLSDDDFFSISNNKNEKLSTVSKTRITDKSKELKNTRIESPTPTEEEKFTPIEKKEEKSRNLETDLKISDSKESSTQQESTNEPKKNTVISNVLNIEGEEPLVKGFHFYSNDRVMDKVKRCAKEKNIKLSRLITMILDKTIREE